MDVLAKACLKVGLHARRLAERTLEVVIARKAWRRSARARARTEEPAKENRGQHTEAKRTQAEG